MPTVLVDTDFLSSFLKVGRCELIRSLYQVEQVLIPAAVYRELAQTDLLTRLLAIPWIRVWPEEASTGEGSLVAPGLEGLGLGEQACILIARGLRDAVLLTSDNVARRKAQSHGIVVANIPAFLIACKDAGLLDSDQMTQVVEDLRQMDFYEFRPEVRDLLLA